METRLRRDNRKQFEPYRLAQCLFCPNRTYSHPELLLWKQRPNRCVDEYWCLCMEGTFC